MVSLQDLQPIGEALDGDGQVWKVLYPASNWTGVLKNLVYPTALEGNLLAEIEKIKALKGSQYSAQYIYHEAWPSSADQSQARVLFEYYSGESLDKVVIQPQRLLHYPVLVGLLHQLTSALAEIHAKGLTHSHLKPSRILLTHQNIDIAEIRVDSLGMTNCKEIVSGVVSTEVADAKYYPPEKWQQYPDMKSDIWALGVIAFEMTCHRYPFRSPDDSEITIESIQLQQEIMLRNQRLDWSEYGAIPGPLQEFIAACLSFDPENRPDSASLLQYPLFTAAPDKNTSLEYEISLSALLNRMVKDQSPLGAGAYGRVWKVQNDELGVEVAMKELDYQPSIQIYIDREITNMRSLREHPSMVRYYFHTFKQKSAERNVTKIYMEHCAGSSLKHAIIVPKQKLPPMLLVHFIKQLTAGIAYMHERGVVHRDIKADNVLLTSTTLSEADIKICDFGMSKYDLYIKMTESKGRVVDMTPNIGTAKYMAPEQLLHLEYNQQVDVWALGIVVFEIFTFENPFVTAGKPLDIPTLISRQQQLERQHLDWKLHPEVPMPVREFVNACLTYQQETRPLAKDLLNYALFTANEQDLRPPEVLPPAPRPDVPALSDVRVLQESSVDLANRTLRYLNDVSRVLGQLPAYNLATYYSNFLQNSIKYLKETEAKEPLEDILQKVKNGFPKPPL